MSMLDDLGEYVLLEFEHLGNSLDHQLAIANRLLEIGHSQRRAVLLIYLWAGVLAFGAVALTFISDAVVVLWAVAFGLLLAALASAVPRMRHRV